MRSQSRHDFLSGQFYEKVCEPAHLWLCGQQARSPAPCSKTWSYESPIPTVVMTTLRAGLRAATSASMLTVLYRFICIAAASMCTRSSKMNKRPIFETSTRRIFAATGASQTLHFQTFTGAFPYARAAVIDAAGELGRTYIMAVFSSSKGIAI